MSSTNSFALLADLDTPTPTDAQKPVEKKTDPKKHVEKKTDPKKPVEKKTDPKKKTQLCKHFEKGECKYGDKCNFAHGASELNIAPPKKVHRTVFKTEPCKHFEKGECKYGDKCNFAHGDNELRDVPRRPESRTLGPYLKAAMTKPVVKKDIKNVVRFEYHPDEFPALPVAEVLTAVSKRMNADAAEFVPATSTMNPEAPEFVPN